MTTKRFDDNPQLGNLAGTEVIPATSVAGGIDAEGNPVAAGSDIKIPVQQMLGMKVHAVAISAGEAVVDCGQGLHRNHTLLLTGSVVLSLSNLASAGYVSEGEVRIAQDATGNRTVTLPSSFRALGGSDTSVKGTPNGVTILSFKTFNEGATVEYAMQESV